MIKPNIFILFLIILGVLLFVLSSHLPVQLIRLQDPIKIKKSVRLTGISLLILGVFQTNMLAASFAGLSIILGAVYMLRAYQKMMLGETNSLTSHFPKLEKQELITLSIIVILIVVMGVYPKPILDITESSIQTLLKGIQ